MRALVSAFACCVATVLGGPVAAQGVSVEWEITNRFAPFEGLGSAKLADEAFDTWRLRPEDDGFEGWHERLDRDLPSGMASPYEANLRRGRALHWDPTTSGHRDNILKYVRQEEHQSVRARIWLNAQDYDQLETQTCWWSFLNATRPCTMVIETEVPLAGTTIQVVVGDEAIEADLTPDHLVIVAMGDSYGSGEGNPDVPASWRNVAGQGQLDWLTKSRFRDRLPQRRWVDDQCHRSFFSFQSLAALQTASENPHRFVSFLHYACSGSEIFDGVLAPQYQRWGEGSFVPYSQVNNALRELCAAPVTRQGTLPRGEYSDITKDELDGIDIRDFERRPYGGALTWTQTTLTKNDSLDTFMRPYRTESGEEFPSVGMMTCPDGKLRTPDMLLLSIGGNDIGFADLVSYALLPGTYDNALVAYFTLPDVCPPKRARVDPRIDPDVAAHCLRLDQAGRPHAGQLINGRGGQGGVDEKLELLINVLEYRLGVAPSDIYMSQYPDPLRVMPTKTNACAPLDTEASVVFGNDPYRRDPLSPWEGLKVVAPFDIASDWQFTLTSEEGHRTLDVFDMLRVKLARAARRNGVNMVCETRDAFIGHGWWRGEHLNLPNAGYSNAYRWNAANWKPYAYVPRDRAIRTGNDSVMTQPHPNTAITGAIHPNLTGHRLLAERMASRMLGDIETSDGFSLGRIGDVLELLE